MQLRLRELEPEVARRVQATARRAVVEGSAKRTELEPIWSIFSLACSVMIVALYFFLVLRVGGPVAVLLMMLSPLLLIVALSLPQRLVPTTVNAPDVHALLAEDTLPRVERLYGETVLMLLETPATKPTPLRELLQEVNRLVAEDRVVAAQQTRLQAAVNPQALQEAETEQLTLVQRLAQEEDTITRETLAESLSLCSERLEHLRALPLLLTRLEAHRELLCQALALAHAALLRTRTTPLTSAPLELATLRSSVRQLTSESRALEEATRSLGA